MGKNKKNKNETPKKTATYAIGIPTLNRADLLVPALLYYKVDFPNTKIYVLDNGNQCISVPQMQNLQVINMDKNIGVAASWNLLLEKIFQEHDNAIIMNDDIYLGKKDWQINMFLTDYHWPLYTNPVDWSVFIMPKKTYQKVGKFDEEFYPAYCEDNDYVYRMKLMGLQIMQIPFLLPKIHLTSQTLEKDNSIQSAFHKNKKRYIEKWGGEPHFERFKTPFNVLSK